MGLARTIRLITPTRLIRRTFVNRLNLYIAASTISLILSGCVGGGSNPVKQATETTTPECQWPDAPGVAAPLWVCDGPIEGVSTYASASHKSKAGNAFMKRIAATEARAMLAEEMKVKVNSMVKNYLGTTGRGDAETIDAVASTTTKSITSGNLVGSKIVRSQLSPSGEMYVVVGLDPQAEREVVKQAVQTSMNSDNAMWQQFMAYKSQNELAEEIAKMEGTGANK